MKVFLVLGFVGEYAERVQGEVADQLFNDMEVDARS